MLPERLNNSKTTTKIRFLMTDWIDESARMDGETMPNGTEKT
jgi:hypothetical protein